MRFEYFPQTDTLYIELRKGPGADALEVAPNIVLDVDETGEVIGIEIEEASRKTNVQDLQFASFPATVAA